MKIFPQLILAASVASLAAAQNYSTDVMSLNPLGYWPLSANTNDTSGHGSNLSAPDARFSTAMLPPIGVGSAAFLTSNQVLALSGAASANYNFTTTSKFTAAFWVKTVMQTNTNNRSSFLLGKGDPTAGTGWGILLDNGDFLAAQGAGRVVFGFFSSNNPILTIESNNLVNDGNWHFIVASSDGTGAISGLHLYIDGQVASSGTVASTGSGTVTTSVPLTIGGSPDGSDLLEGNIAGVAVFTTTLTVQQVAQLVEDTGITRAALSQFAFGGGWYSAVYFTNIGLGTVSFTVTFTADAGTPLIIPSLNSGSTVVTLAPGTSTVIEGISTGNLQQGYVTANLPAFVTGYGLFRQSAPGVPDQEAVVPLSPAGSGSVGMLYDETGGIVTAVAIANSSGNPITVTVSVIDTNGNVLGTVALPTIQPNNKTEATLVSFVPQITGTRGGVKFSSSNGGLSVLGIRFRGNAFTSIPTQNFRLLGLLIGEQ